jgi:hypothetical protein
MRFIGDPWPKEDENQAILEPLPAWSDDDLRLDGKTAAKAAVCQREGLKRAIRLRSTS